MQEDFAVSEVLSRQVWKHGGVRVGDDHDHNHNRNHIHNDDDIDAGHNNQMNLIDQGSILRQLRQLEIEDELERSLNSTAILHKQSTYNQNTTLDDDNDDNNIDSTFIYRVSSIPQERIIFQYETGYLVHQRYYDDLKHINYNFIDYGSFDSIHSRLVADDRDSNESVTLMKRHQEKRRPLVIEQDKTLGKGGLCWDAAFILGEYMISILFSTTIKDSTNQLLQSGPIRIIELGAGTGLCGLMIAHFAQFQQPEKQQQNDGEYSSTVVPQIQVTVTDLLQLFPLLNRNVVRNFYPQYFSRYNYHDHDVDDFINDCILDEYFVSKTVSDDIKDGNKNSQQQYHNRNNTIQPWEHFSQPSKNGIKDTSTTMKMIAPLLTTSVLDWSNEQQINEHGTYDVIIGADVVATLYDPIALAQTIYKLCHDDDINNIAMNHNEHTQADNSSSTSHPMRSHRRGSIVYISFKERLSSIHREFENEMHNLFDTIEIIENVILTNIDDTAGSHSCKTIGSRNRNPDVRILIAQNKKKQFNS